MRTSDLSRYASNTGRVCWKQRRCIGINCTPNHPDAPLPSFKGWSSTTAGVAEVLAGNHRVGALKAYLKQQKLTDDDDERWWVCNIFDRGMCLD